MKFNKKVMDYLGLYISLFTYDVSKPYVLFVHGGPGYNCGVIEYLIECHQWFDSLNCNIILYDQRACGKSARVNSQDVIHSDNVSDLHDLLDYFKSQPSLNIIALMGHSYGAKIIVDYHEQYPTALASIFIATANSMLIPRLNNLLLDLGYLKRAYPERYQAIVNKMDNINLEKIWRLTEELAPFFAENTDRPYHYWANLDVFKLVQEIQAKLGLTTNNQVFMSVRKSLYAPSSNYSVDIEGLQCPTLWVNGFHDRIMNGADGLMSEESQVKILFKSGHYPHLEENSAFCHLVNHFLQEVKLTSNQARDLV